MRILFFLLVGSSILIFFGLADILLLKYLNRTWWRFRWLRKLAWLLPGVGLLFFWTFAAGIGLQTPWVYTPGAIGTCLVFLIEVGLLIAFILSGVVHLFNGLLTYVFRGISAIEKSPVDLGRRRFLQGLAVSVPAATVGMTGYGFGRSFYSADVSLRTVTIPTLPDSLVGTRILHLSDLHLSEWVTLDHLTEVLEQVEEYHPDVVFVTGDIADNLAVLPDALKLMEGLQAPLGAFATFGNHEYFRGPDQVRRDFDQSTIPLLVNDAVRLTRNGESILIGGIDDPRRMHGGDPTFFRNCLKATFPEEADASLVLLLSHRPRVFPQAIERKIHLTLAGHWHGGQVGMFGRSVFESVFPDSYLWGHYEEGESHLYTTSGVGHWFPFRLGCPPEAPVIELVNS